MSSSSRERCLKLRGGRRPRPRPLLQRPPSRPSPAPPSSTALPTTPARSGPAWPSGRRAWARPSAQPSPRFWPSITRPGIVTSMTCRKALKARLVYPSEFSRDRLCCNSSLKVSCTCAGPNCGVASNTQAGKTPAVLLFDTPTYSTPLAVVPTTCAVRGTTGATCTGAVASFPSTYAKKLSSYKMCFGGATN
jgi:hypothetical protein